MIKYMQVFKSNKFFFVKEIVMKEQIKGIVLVLFGILLCCASDELNSTIFGSIADLPVALLGVLSGIVGVFFAFRNTKDK